MLYYTFDIIAPEDDRVYVHWNGNCRFHIQAIVKHNHMFTYISAHKEPRAFATPSYVLDGLSRPAEVMARDCYLHQRSEILSA